MEEEQRVVDADEWVNSLLNLSGVGDDIGQVDDMLHVTETDKECCRLLFDGNDESASMDILDFSSGNLSARDETLPTPATPQDSREHNNAITNEMYNDRNESNSTGKRGVQTSSGSQETNDQTSSGDGKKDEVGDSENADEKRKARLQRNKESAHLSRQRKKMYVDELEQRCRMLQRTNTELHALVGRLTNENKALREQMTYIFQHNNTAGKKALPLLNCTNVEKNKKVGAPKQNVTSNKAHSEINVQHSPSSKNSMKRKASSAANKPSKDRRTVGTVAALAALSFMMVMSIPKSTTMENTVSMLPHGSRRSLLALTYSSNVSKERESFKYNRYVPKLFDSSQREEDIRLEIRGENRTVQRDDLPRRRKTVRKDLPMALRDSDKSVAIMSLDEKTATGSHINNLEPTQIYDNVLPLDGSLKDGTINAFHFPSETFISKLNPVMCVEIFTFDSANKGILGDENFEHIKDFIQENAGYSLLQKQADAEKENKERLSLPHGSISNDADDSQENPNFNQTSTTEDSPPVSIVSLLLPPSTKDPRQLYVVTVSEMTKYITYSCNLPSAKSTYAGWNTGWNLWN